MTVAVYRSSGTDIEHDITAHVHDLSLDQLCPTTVQNAKILVMDTFGAILSAIGHPSVAPVTDLVADWGGRADARVLGSGKRLIAHHAALANGTMARALEIDDVHEPAMLHATATIVPVALAASELAGGVANPVAGREFLAAVIAGIDVCARLSLSALRDPSETGPRTMSFTYQTGILAGALVAGRLLGLSKSEMRNALGIAYSQCAGNQQALFEGVATVRVQQGLSAMTAMNSVQLAMAGVTGVSQSLSGAAGFFSAFHHGRCDHDVLLGNLGHCLETDNVSIKPFPCCKYTHTAIAAAQKAYALPGFDVARIRKVVAHVNSPEYFDIVCLPSDPVARRAELSGPDGRVRGQFSLAYLVATALRHGTVELLHLDDEARADPATLDLTDRVETIVDEDFLTGAARPEMPAPGILDIHLEGEAQPTIVTCDLPPGHPKNRMSAKDVEAKFLRAMVEPG